MEGQTFAWTNLLYSWAPIIVMIGLWVFLMRKVGSFQQRKYVDRNLALMERQEQLLERIAVALEQRNARQR